MRHSMPPKATGRGTRAPKSVQFVPVLGPEDTTPGVDPQSFDINPPDRSWSKALHKSNAVFPWSIIVRNVRDVIRHRRCGQKFKPDMPMKRN